MIRVFISQKTRMHFKRFRITRMGNPSSKFRLEKSIKQKKSNKYNIEGDI